MKITNRILQLLFVTLGTCVFTACAASKDGIYYQDIRVESKPPGAIVRLGEKEKTTPAVFNIKRGAVNIPLSISKKGYMPVHKTLRSKANVYGWFFGNEEDLLSGRASVYSPSSIDVDLEELKNAKDIVKSVEISKLEISPNPVPAGSRWGFRVSFTVRDNTIVEEKVPVRIAFSTTQGGEILYQDSGEFNITRGTLFVWEKNNLNSGETPGNYTLNVSVAYGLYIAKMQTALIRD